MHAGIFSRIDKRAGGNKAMQVGIFQNSLVKNHEKWKNLKKIINVQKVIRLCRLEIFKKLMICAARLLDTLEYFQACALVGVSSECIFLTLEAYLTTFFSNIF